MCSLFISVSEEMGEIKASDVRQNIGASVQESVERTEVEISEEAAVGELEIWQTKRVDNIGCDAGGINCTVLRMWILPSRILLQYFYHCYVELI